jgi:hypothetical protein
MCLDMVEKRKIAVPVRNKILAIKYGNVLIIPHWGLLEN